MVKNNLLKIRPFIIIGFMRLESVNNPILYVKKYEFYFC